jgi:hypothetical protein
MIDPGQTAPDFELPDKDGNPVRLSDLRASPTCAADSSSSTSTLRRTRPGLEPVRAFLGLLSSKSEIRLGQRAAVASEERWRARLPQGVRPATASEWSYPK